METRNEINEAAEFSITFQMVGDSMDNGSKRSFSDGDYLICDEVGIQDIQIGRKYVIKVGSYYIVRLITSIDDGVFTCAPINPNYKGSQICLNDTHQIFIAKSRQRKVANSQEGGIR